MAWIAMMLKNLKTKDYVLMQAIKGSSTLRISSKGEKPSPRSIYHEGTQVGQITARALLYNVPLKWLK
jgi:hypothetical protein